MNLTLYEIAKSKSFKKSFYLYLWFLLPALFIEQILGFILVLSLWITLKLFFQFYQEKHNYATLHQSNAVVSQILGLRKRYGSIKQYANTLVFKDIYDDSHTILEGDGTVFEYSYVLSSGPDDENHLVNIEIGNRCITMKEFDFYQLEKGFKQVKAPPYAKLKRMLYYLRDLLLISILFSVGISIFLFYSMGTFDLSTLKHLLLTQSTTWLILITSHLKLLIKKSNYAILTTPPL